MRNLLLLSAAGLALAACQATGDVAKSSTSSQAPSMAYPAPQGGLAVPSSALSQPTSTTGQSPSMSSTSSTVGLSAPNTVLNAPTGTTGQSPSMAPSASQVGVLRSAVKKPVIVTDPSNQN
jgi:hypothetical protein